MLFRKKTDEEKRCTKYLNELIDSSFITAKLDFKLKQSTLNINDINLFHKIAQALDYKEINYGFGKCFYYVDIPLSKEHNSTRVLILSLEKPCTKNFFHRYGGYYTFNLMSEL